MHAIAADFVQSLENRLLGRTTRSTGALYQRQPDRFLMDFSDPAGDVIVSDGRYFWMYFPSVDEKQVLRSPRGGQGLDLHAQFIGDPVARFEITYHGTEDAGGGTAHVMTLDPRPDLGYDRLKVWIDAEDYLVRRFELTESNGNVRRIELRNVVVNPSLPDSLFEFTPPPGALVVTRG
jgi:outer membrane lipoprotein carrier protein